MTSIMGALKVRVDENDADKISKVKKFGVPTTTEVTKRAALGDLQNRGVLRAATGKDAAQKDLNEVKLQNALKTTKARVDSYWKKAPLGTATNGTIAQAANALAGQNGTAAAVGQRKILTRSHSVRLGTNGTGTGGGALQRHGSSNLLVGQNKPKTLTTKVIENKPQHAKPINRAKSQEEEKPKTLTVDPKLRREDSNLSRKSLSKLKAALSRDASATGMGSAKSAAAAAAKAAGTAAVPKAKEDKALGAKSVGPPVACQSELKIVSVQTHSAKLLSAVEDIDAGDGENLVLVSEYVNDIYNYLYSLETEHAIRENHLDGQVEVFPKMRAVLLDWINEVHLQFHLAAETYQMAVAIIDRYLQIVKDTKRSQLQLVGVTALFIAAKYEELLPPSIGDFVYITDDSYTAREILQMELKIFRALDCNLSRPLPIHFLRRFSKAAKAEDSHHTMSKYFLELASIEYELAAYKPSEIAAASLFLSLHLLKDKSKVASGFKNAHWTPTLEWYSRYTPGHLRPITQKIAAIARNAPNAKLKSIYTKCLSSKFQKISLRSELYSPLMDSIIGSK